MLIFDASGSMWGQIAKEPKIDIARRVLKDVLTHVPPEAGVGLVAYGHRSKTDCADIETILAPGSQDRTALLRAVDAMQPKGKTPITASIQKTFELLRTREAANTVILISDGLETCDGDPCKAVRAAREAGGKFVLHVVGFDMGSHDVSQLECAAQAGGGLYFTAADAADLGKALQQAVAMTAETPAGKLSIKALADGKLTDAMVQISDAAGGASIVGQRTYTRSDTNPRLIPLPDGKYDVSVRSVTIKGAPEQKLSGIEIRNGGTVEKVVDFSTGTLRVKVTRNGKLSDATVTAYRSGTSEIVAGSRTYTRADSNPSSLRLQAGSYDIVISSVEIAGKPTHRWDKVAVEGTAVVDLQHELASGVLRVGAKAAGKLVDAVVRVSRSGAKETEAQGRTYTAATSNPKTFELGPGTYTVTVSPVKPLGAEPVVLEATIEAGGTVERTAEFSIAK